MQNPCYTFKTPLLLPLLRMENLLVSSSVNRVVNLVDTIFKDSGEMGQWLELHCPVPWS